MTLSGAEGALAPQRTMTLRIVTLPAACLQSSLSPFFWRPPLLSKLASTTKMAAEERKGDDVIASAPRTAWRLEGPACLQTPMPRRPTGIWNRLSRLSTGQDIYFLNLSFSNSVSQSSAFRYLIIFPLVTNYVCHSCIVFVIADI